MRLRRNVQESDFGAVLCPVFPTSRTGSRCIWNECCALSAASIYQVGSWQRAVDVAGRVRRRSRPNASHFGTFYLDSKIPSRIRTPQIHFEAGPSSRDNAINSYSILELTLCGRHCYSSSVDASMIADKNRNTGRPWSYLYPATPNPAGRKAAQDRRLRVLRARHIRQVSTRSHETILTGPRRLANYISHVSDGRPCFRPGTGKTTSIPT